MGKVLCLSVVGNENDIYNNGNVSNIIFTIKVKKVYVPLVILPPKDNQK